MSRSEFEYDVCEREHDGSWQVVAKLSSVRIGETDRDNVKAKIQTDHMKWIVVFVSKSEESCKKWVDSNWDNLITMGIPYEVG